jgi:hypothetical protein
MPPESCLLRSLASHINAGELFRFDQLNRRSSSFKLSDLVSQLLNLHLSLGYAVLEGCVLLPAPLQSFLVFGNPSILCGYCYASAARLIRSSGGFVVQQLGSAMFTDPPLPPALLSHGAPPPVAAGIIDGREEAHDRV